MATFHYKQAELVTLMSHNAILDLSVWGGLVINKSNTGLVKK